MQSLHRLSALSSWRISCRPGEIVAHRGDFMLDWDEERNSQHRRLCSYALTFAHIGEQTILAKVTDETTKEQCEIAQRQLLELATWLAGQATLFHYPTTTGTHFCVWDIYTDLSMRLKNLYLMQKPEPHQPPPAPRSKPLTPEEIINDLEAGIQASEPEMYFGTDDLTPGDGDR
jgi:hypothetical protein